MKLTWKVVVIFIGDWRSPFTAMGYFLPSTRCHKEGPLKEQNEKEKTAYVHTIDFIVFFKDYTIVINLVCFM